METFKNRLIGVFLIIVAIFIVIWPFLVPANITEIIKWLAVIILVVIGVLLLIQNR
ncbi:MAG: hypothetical protein QME14_00270 [Methanobacteriaceae archaeon]|nr:hypothetical protein [Methanobacteriaceae archaeon]